MKLYTCTSVLDWLYPCWTKIQGSVNFLSTDVNRSQPAYSGYSDKIQVNKEDFKNKTKVEFRKTMNWQQCGYPEVMLQC